MRRIPAVLALMLLALIAVLMLVLCDCFDFDSLCGYCLDLG